MQAQHPREHEHLRLACGERIAEHSLDFRDHKGHLRDFIRPAKTRLDTAFQQAGRTRRQRFCRQGFHACERRIHPHARKAYGIHRDICAEPYRDKRLPALGRVMHLDGKSCKLVLPCGKKQRRHQRKHEDKDKAREYPRRPETGNEPCGDGDRENGNAHTARISKVLAPQVVNAHQEPGTLGRAGNRIQEPDEEPSHSRPLISGFSLRAKCLRESCGSPHRPHPSRTRGVPSPGAEPSGCRRDSRSRGPQCKPTPAPS